MALTREQFQQLRNKGLSPQQIANFEAGNQPQSTTPTTPTKLPQTKIGEVAEGAGRGIIKTLSGISSLGERGLKAVTGGIGALFTDKTFQDVKQDIKAPTSAERLIPEELRTNKGLTGLGKVGMGAEQVAEYFIPGTSALKLSKAIKGVSTGAKLARFGVRSLAEAGITGGQAALQEGKVDEKVGSISLFGGVAPLIGKTIGLTSKGIPKLMRFISPVDDEAFNVLKNRFTGVNKAVKEGPTAQKTLDYTRQKAMGLKEKLSKEWKQGVGAIKNEFKQQRIDFPKPIVNKMTAIAEQYRAFDLPRNMKSITVGKGLEVYNKLNSLYGQRAVRESAEGAILRKLRTDYRKFLVQGFGGEGGAIDNLLKNYSAKSDIFSNIDDLVKVFGKKPVESTTAANRLQAIFEENKLAYLDAVIQFEKETGADVLSRVAAQKFQQILPSGITKASGGLPTKADLLQRVVQILALPLTSPRLALERARAGEALKPLLNKTSNIPGIKQTGQRVFGDETPRLSSQL
ncbi:hypothetical protein M0R04_10715 [Candidatus Dojkabacteria bacterium]|jgi:hypothetical protein|nr:hypothetical protein [Candidatus Dojkabacteria bacterium]